MPMTPMRLPAGTASPEADIRITFDNSYASQLGGGAFYIPWQPAIAPRPELLYFNAPLATKLGLLQSASGDNPATQTESARLPPPDELAALFSCNRLPPDAQPIAQAYAGHQFGHFSPQLGDGRALLVGEVIDPQGRRHDVAFKGSGRTPFSRGGDGKAAVGPMLREVLVGQCMHALGIPTTQALAVVATGEVVHRESVLPGAVLTRVADSHLRVGTFEYFSARRMTAEIRRLFDYAVARHDPDLPDDAHRPVHFFAAVCRRQARLLAQWTGVGFIHGVMNTDNMALSGQTIDYGPCAFMEAYNPATVFSSIDQHGRYAFANQPAIAQWNLARLAECLLPLMPDEDEALALLGHELDVFTQTYQQHWLSLAARKLGVSRVDEGSGASPGAPDVSAVPQCCEPLLARWLQLLQDHAVDYTLGWRYLCDAAQGNHTRLLSLFAGADAQTALSAWLVDWRQHLVPDAAVGMRQVNPWLIARNAAVEQALQAASSNGDLAPFNRLLDALQTPYEEREAFADLARPAPPEQARCYKTFCGT